MSTTTEQYRTWTISYRDQTPPEIERVEAQFVSYSARFQKVFLQRKGATYNPEYYRFSAEDHEFLNRLFETVGYRLDSPELPKALEKDEGAPIGVFGSLLVNLAVADAPLLLDGILTDVELSQLKRMPNLNFLTFVGNRVQTDESLETLVKWSKPEFLSFEKSNITDLGLKAISQMKCLRSLYLMNCNQITDAGFAWLGELDFLKVLELSNFSNITDTALEKLHVLKNLERFIIRECPQITPQAVERLKNALSDTKVWWRSENN